MKSKINLMMPTMTEDCIVAEVQLKYKPNPISTTICGSKDLYDILVNKVFDEDTIGYKETFKLLLFNQANMLIGYSTISNGGIAATVVDVRVVMQTALVSNASAIVLAHNHPSGTLKTSCHDDNITRKVKLACDVMDIRLLDHIIVTPFGEYYSYRDNGKI